MVPHICNSRLGFRSQESCESEAIVYHKEHVSNPPPPKKLKNIAFRQNKRTVDYFKAVLNIQVEVKWSSR
ncbi:mCG146400 [Mus musculus]|nr:mCG146400 [Mus musculus]